MKKLIILSSFLIITILCSYEMLSLDCEPCTPPNWTSDNLGFSYDNCDLTVYFDYETCNSMCYFRIEYIIEDFAGCLDWAKVDIAGLLLEASKEIIQDNWNTCVPSGANDCVENIESYMVICWKWDSLLAPSGPPFAKLVPCLNAGCCETHWMWCNDAEGYP